MNILQLFWGGGEGGDAAACIELARVLKQRGINVHTAAYAATHPAEFTHRAKVRGLVDSEDFKLISMPERLWEETGWSQKQFDLLHVHHGRTIPKRSDIIPLRKIARRLPIFLTAHGPLPLCSIEYGGWKSRVSRYISPLWFKAIVVPSQAKLKEWQAMTPFSRRVTAIANVVAPLSRVNKTAVRESLHLSPSARVVLYCSRLDEEKDPRTFIRAVAQAAATDVTLVGIMAGSGALTADCRKLICELDAPIKVLGYVQDVAPLYAAADVFVQTSKHESFCITMLQALQARLPVVASDLDVLRELYSGDSPQFVPPGNEGAFAEAILAARDATSPNPKLDEASVVQEYLDLWSRDL